MRLHFLRHAIAEDRLQWLKADIERPLTEGGRKKFKEAARGLRKGLRFEFDWILTSPARRAYDTARLLAGEFDAMEKLKISKSLLPEGDAKLLMRHLALDFRTWENIVLVGHEPSMSQLISVLISGSSELGIELKKGGLCTLQAHSLTYGRCATLECLLTPKQLRRSA